MAPIATIAASAGAVDADFWPRLAAAVHAAWRTQGIEPRDAVVLLPYANLLPVVRDAFAQTGAWQPRIETIATLADALGPAPVLAAQHVTGDMRIDSLQAQRMLAAEQGVGLAQTFATLAQALSQAQAAWPPNERAQRWQALRDDVPPLPAGAPGGVERGLLRAAIAWAAVNEQTPADRVWRHRFSALVVVQAGGEQEGATAVMNAAASAGTPVLQVQTDPQADGAFEAIASLPPPHTIVCDDAAHEAREAAWCVVEALQAGHKPVALVAQDRQIVRRIHAVLAQRGWGVHDDTGWALSTTRAAARVMAVLRAVSAPNSRDAELDAMKALGWTGDDLAALSALEQSWRNDRHPTAAAVALIERWRRHCAGLRDAPEQALQRWLQLLVERFSPLWSSLSADPAGRAVLQALWLDRADGAQAEPAQQHASNWPLRWPGLVAWAEQALEQAAYMPAPAADPDVVITPLARTVLRPFGAVVFAGCDERFGAPLAAPSGWQAAVATAHGLPHDKQRRERERAAFVQLLRQPRVVLLRRRSHNGEPIAASRWFEQAQSARRRLGHRLIDERPASGRATEISMQPVPRPAPCVMSPDLLPERWSASLIEALRACPYRFFSRGVLRLGEAAELDLEWQKRDHGDWLHKVLHRFHLARPAPRTPHDDIAALLAAAQAESDAATRQQDRDGADLLPFEAGFAPFAQHYVEWLQTRDAQGWRYAQGEVARERVLPGLTPQAVLVGRIDRIDERDNQDLHLIDYKTGGAAALKRKVREPLEDTQLAAYAALMQADVTQALPLQASYLALDDREAPASIEHRDVTRSAHQLMQHLPAEIARLREGAPMPALGEGSVCEFCEARGLCRRDHWAPLA